MRTGFKLVYNLNWFGICSLQTGTGSENRSNHAQVRLRNGFTVFKMVILQDDFLQCGECNDILKDSDGFNLDIAVSIDRENSELQHLFVCSLKLSLKIIISNKIAGIFVCSLNDICICICICICKGTLQQHILAYIKRRESTFDLMTVCESRFEAPNTSCAHN